MQTTNPWAIALVVVVLLTLVLGVALSRRKPADPVDAPPDHRDVVQ
jgi:hypothetical protein